MRVNHKERLGRVAPGMVAAYTTYVTLQQYAWRIAGPRDCAINVLINGPIACIDLVVPNGAGTGSAHVYYPFRGRMRDAVGVFTVQR